jgi:hypothetical protein
MFTALVQRTSLERDTHFAHCVTNSLSEPPTLSPSDIEVNEIEAACKQKLYAEP